MATARCYTKSGSVEKHELNCFSGITLCYPNNFTSKLVGPDSDGNYSITYDNYGDGTISDYDCYCKTIYGPDWRNNKGEIKTFYFKKKIHNIYLSSIIEFTGVEMNIILSFSNNQYLGNDSFGK